MVMLSVSAINPLIPNYKEISHAEENNPIIGNLSTTPVRIVSGSSY